MPLLPSQPFTRQEIIGFVIGSVSSVLYLFSRLPQIRTNVSHVQGGRGQWKRGPSGSSSFWVREQRGVGVLVQKSPVHTHCWLGAT